MSAERRVEERFATYVAVEITGEGKSERFGVSRDASTGGMKLATPSHFSVGAELTLRLHAPGRPPAELVATVLRVELSPPGSAEPWRYRLAVQFADPDAAAQFLAAAPPESA